MVFIFEKYFSLFIFLSTGIVVHPIHDQQTDDNMCPNASEILCVQKVLLKIATTAKSVIRMANEIEKHILSTVDNVGHLNRYVDSEKTLITYLPVPQYHSKFLRKDDIYKTDLIYLVLEAHHALGFYYNSITEILNMNDAFSSIIDEQFEQIQVNLKSSMICRYRSILNVYSHRFPFITQIDPIKFSLQNYKKEPSFLHHVRSIVVVKLLREWMQRINSVIVHIEKKSSD